MAAWTDDELQRISDSDELEIAAVRRDGTLRGGRPIWVVRVADDRRRIDRTKGELVQLTRNSLDTIRGPDDWFTGAVYIDAVASPSPHSRVGAAMVHFTPGARTAWHTHPFGQTIYVTDGNGVCQRRGGSIEKIHPGDRVYFEPGEDHWHGASPNRFMTHLAIQEADDEGSPVTWGAHVGEEEYSPGRES